MGCNSHDGKFLLKVKDGIHTALLFVESSFSFIKFACNRNVEVHLNNFFYFAKTCTLFLLLVEIHLCKAVAARNAAFKVHDVGKGL